MISVLMRTTIMFFLVIFTMRLMGKKSLGEFQPSDLVSVMLISNLTSIVIEAPELPILYSAVPILLITCYEVFMSVAVRKNDCIAKLAQGKSMVLIKNGIIDQQVMKDLRFTTVDILEALRKKDIFYLEEVNLALVETNGGISIYPAPDADTNIKKADIPPFIIISDGKINYDNLQIIGLAESRLFNILEKENADLSDILLLLVDGNLHYNLTKKEIA